MAVSATSRHHFGRPARAGRAAQTRRTRLSRASVRGTSKSAAVEGIRRKPNADPLAARVSGLSLLIASRWSQDALLEQVNFVELGGVVIPPFAERGDDRLQAEAELRRRVFHPRRHLFEDLPVYDPVLFHLTQLLDDHLLAGVGQQLPQLGESFWSIEQVTKDRHLPAPTDHLDRALHGQGGQALDWVSDGDLPVGMSRKSV